MTNTGYFCYISYSYAMVILFFLDLAGRQGFVLFVLFLERGSRLHDYPFSELFAVVVMYCLKVVTL